MHIAGGEGGGDLDLDTVTMTRGALGLQDKVSAIYERKYVSDDCSDE